MKSNYLKVLGTLVLTLALTPYAFADDGFIHTEIAPPPPPPASGFMHTEPTDGIIWTEAANTVTEVGLSLLQSLSWI